MEKLDRRFKDTEEMVQWMCFDQEGSNNRWNICRRQSRKEVLEKYNVVVSKRGAYKGRGVPSENGSERQKYQPRKWGGDC